ncbi:hypothetical protein [Paracoccus simplex]
MRGPRTACTPGAEYVAERNRLVASHVDDRAAKERKLTKVIKEQDVLVNALLSGLPPERIRAKMEQLEVRQKQLETELAAAPASTTTTRLHPRIAETYHDRIQALIVGLIGPSQRATAKLA